MSKRKSDGPLGLSAPPPDLSTENERDNDDDGEGEGTGLLAGSKRSDTLKKKVANATLARTKAAETSSNGSAASGKEKDKKDKPETPLPKMKVALVGMVLFADTFSQLLIFPFLPFMVHDFFPHLNKHELGYYAGYLGGMFYIGSFSFNIFWGRQADRYGRRPIMIMGMVGTIISTLLFGISQSFYWALIVRFLWGSMNGNIGIAKTYLSEVCDDSNSGRAFSLMGMLVGLGRIFGPAIGGFLAQPAQKYPSVFGHSAVFTKYAYLLPCLFAAAFGSLLLLGVLFYMEETLHSPLPIRLMFASQKSHDQALKEREKELKLLHLKSHDEAEADDERHHISHKTMDLLKQREVFLSCVLYGLLAMTALVSNEIFPLWVVAKKEFHGFDFGTSDIGTIHSLLGPTQIFYQFMIYPHLLKRYGVLKLFKICTVLFSISLAVFPFVEVTQQWGWSRFAVCTVMFLALVFMVNVRNTCFTCVFVFVANSCISQVRGTVNGIGQSFAAAGRALGPTVFSSVFAWTMGNHLGWPFNFHFLWDFLAISSLVLCWIATHLPDTIVARKDAPKPKGDSTAKSSGDTKPAASSGPAKTNKVSPLPAASSDVAVPILPDPSPSASPSSSSAKLVDEFPPLHHLKPNMYVNLSVMPPVEPLPVPIELDSPASDRLDRGVSDDTSTLSNVMIETASPSNVTESSNNDGSLLSQDEDTLTLPQSEASESSLNPLDNPAPASSPAPLPSFSALLDQPPKLKAKIARSKKKKSKKGQGQNLPAVHEHGLDEDDE